MGENLAVIILSDQSQINPVCIAYFFYNFQLLNLIQGIILFEQKFNNGFRLIFVSSDEKLVRKNIIQFENGDILYISSLPCFQDQIDEIISLIANPIITIDYISKLILEHNNIPLIIILWKQLQSSLYFAKNEQASKSLLMHFPHYFERNLLKLPNSNDDVLKDDEEIDNEKENNGTLIKNLNEEIEQKKYLWGCDLSQCVTGLPIQYVNFNTQDIIQNEEQQQKEKQKEEQLDIGIRQKINIRIESQNDKQSDFFCLLTSRYYYEDFTQIDIECKQQEKDEQFQEKKNMKQLISFRSAVKNLDQFLISCGDQFNKPDKEDTKQILKQSSSLYSESSTNICPYWEEMQPCVYCIHIQDSEEKEQKDLKVENLLKSTVSKQQQNQHINLTLTFNPFNFLSRISDEIEYSKRIKQSEQTLTKDQDQLNQQFQIHLTDEIEQSLKKRIQITAKRRKRRNNIEKEDKQKDSSTQMTLNPTFLPQSLISRLTMILIPLINYNIKNRQPTTLLFSGGLDSSLLAGICAHILEGEIIREKKEKKDQNEQIQNENEICIGGAGSIELINVAFGPPFTTPDRSSSLLSLLNLTLNFPFVHFFLFLNDISNQQIKPMKQRLERAMWPRNTVMDIGLAVTAFAGLVECQLGRNGFEEQVQQNEKNQSSKIVISGLGPDEMAGGYRHHHRKYEISKQKTIVQLMKAREQKEIVLSDEEIMQQAEDAAISSSSSSMLFDMGRIWYRNNARDSRTADAASNYVQNGNSPIGTTIILHAYNSLITSLNPIRSSLPQQSQSQSSTQSSSQSSTTLQYNSLSSINIIAPYIHSSIFKLIFQSNPAEISGINNKLLNNVREMHKTSLEEIIEIARQEKERQNQINDLEEEYIYQNQSSDHLENINQQELFPQQYSFFPNDKFIFRQSAYLIGLDYSASQPKTAMQFGSRSSKLSRANGDQQISITPWAEDKMNQNIEKTGNKKKDKFKREEQNQNIINLIQEKEQDQKEEQIKSEDGQS